METGSIVFGPLPCGDGRGLATHPGLVVAIVGKVALVVVGTSQHLPTHPLEGQLVVGPDRATAEEWAATGLDKPTQFDGIGGTVAVVRIDRARIIGTVNAKQAWWRAARAVGRAAMMTWAKKAAAKMPH
ncbi:hypothetical protein AB7849_15185 [Rhodanobacter sp. 115]|uniref:hypothetical protein n=1 Tax=Rhodanobacter sp. FW021-MT20 TaxID=1162282 RepID=UPI0034E47D07